MNTETNDSAAQEAVPPAVETGTLRSAQEVANRVHSLIRGRLQGKTPAAVAGRAHLRSALGKEVGSVPAIWSYTMETNETDGYIGLSDTPTRGERAVHTALTLWALHQGSSSRPMHRKWERPRSIGGTVRHLAHSQAGADKKAEEHPVYQRLCAMIAAPTYEALEIHARGMVNLLKSAEVPMDYSRFASDLYKWQDPKLRPSVVRNWGRDFARKPDRGDTDSPSSTTSTTNTENN